MTRWSAAIGVGVAAFAAGRVAMMPGVGFWDTAELQTVAPIMGTAHSTGFPTYVLLGWLANIILTPFGEPAFRMNLLAAICLGVAAAVTVDLVRALTRSTIVGVAAGVGFALTGIVWAIGTHADAHALHLALVAILFRLLVAWEDARREPEAGAEAPQEGWSHPEPDRRADRLLIVSAIVFGLALGNHSLTLLLAPPIALYVVAVEPAILRRPRFVLTCAAALAITIVLVFLELPLRAGPFRAPLVYGTPDTWDGFWYVVLAQQFQGSLVDPLGDVPAKLADLARRAGTAFGPLALLLPAGLVATALRRPRYALLSGSAALITCVFAASYENADIERYYLVPVLLGWTWLGVLAVVGIDALSGELTSPRGAEATGWRSPRGLATAVVALAILVPTVVAAPGRLPSVDRSRDDTAARWLDATLAAMEPDALIVSWWSYSTPLWYAQHVEGRRPDIAIVDDRTRLDQNLGDITDVIDANLPIRPVYVIRLDPAEIQLLEERYELEVIHGQDASGLTRVIGPRAAGG